MSAAAVDRLPSEMHGHMKAITSTVGLSIPDAAMMTALLQGPSSYGSKADILINTMQLVEPKQHVSVPNHVLDTKLYSTIGKNAVFQARPAVLNFAGFHVGRVRRLRLDLVNASNDVQRMHVIPPQTKHFRINYTKKLKLVPGVSLSCVVEFCPDECRYYYDSIRIHCKGEDNLIVPIHAYPIINTSEFPKRIDFSLVPVGESAVTKEHNDIVREVWQNKWIQTPAEDAEARGVTDHGGLDSPGVVPGNGEVDICVTFRPTSFETATGKIRLDVSQFDMKPLVCELFGRSAPGLAQEIAVKTVREDPAWNQYRQLNAPTMSTLDPSLVSPLALARSRKARLSASSVSATIESVQAPELRNGLMLPQNLDNPHAVSLVLGQKTGQLKMKHLQEALHSKTSGSLPMTRQMKEAQFEMAVRKTAYEERQNQLRWQVRQGDELPTLEDQVKVIDDRLEDWKMYKRLRGDANPEVDFCRATCEVLMRRTWREASETAPYVAEFDLYSNDMWAARQRVVTKFQQAAFKIVIRLRMMQRLRALQKYLAESGCAVEASDDSTNGPISLTRPQSIDRFMFKASNVSSVTFPVYVSPTLKDDLAVDTLGPVTTVPNVLCTDYVVPFYPLQVPQYSKLCGYSRCDVQQASVNYVKPVYLCNLRSGPEDQPLLKQTEALTVSSTTKPRSELEPHDPEKPSERQGEQSVQEVDRSTLVVDLCPPPAIFKPIKYQPLHIFNPAPGLITMLPPLAYSETDSDFHVCPLPRFTVSDCDANSQYATQKKYLDRQEIIKGVMTWKKLASPSIASTTNVPSLSNIWVPRWSDPFNEEMLSCDVPGIQSRLSGDDESCGMGMENDLDDCGGVVQLTMDMVKAEFAAIELAYAQEEAAAQEAAPIVGKKVNAVADTKAVVRVASKKSQEAVFPLGNKLPATNLPSSDKGPVSRDYREVDLNVFLRRKHNILGRKVDSRIAAINQLKKNHSLVLQ